VGYGQVCFRVEDAEAAVAELERCGVAVLAGPTVNCKIVYFKDNNGIPIEFVQYL
jgi:catechol 2,3-dioxygenase-like lactoylglutathione lyase family enzyme